MEPRNFPEDENIGWNHFDDVQPSMPFAGGSGLNIGMDSHEPVYFFNLLYVGNMWDIKTREFIRHKHLFDSPYCETFVHSVQ